VIAAVTHSHATSSVDYSGGGGGGGIARNGRSYGVPSLAWRRCPRGFSAVPGFPGVVADSASSAGYSLGNSATAAAATFSAESETAGLAPGGGGGRSPGAWGRGGGVSLGRTILGADGEVGGATDGGRASGGGLGAGTFFETRRRTLGFPGDPESETSDGGGAVDTGRASVWTGSGWGGTAGAQNPAELGLIAG